MINDPIPYTKYELLAVSGTLRVGPLYEGIEYTLKEVTPPEGYALSDNTVRFIVKKNEEGKAQLQILEGEIKSSADFESGVGETKLLANFETEEEISTYLEQSKSEPAIDKDGNSMEGKYAFAYVDGSARILDIVIALDNEPLFVLTKIDGETKVSLPNVKFAITKIEDDGTEMPATNTKGEIIGTKEIINGKEYYTVTTDQKGQI